MLSSVISSAMRAACFRRIHNGMQKGLVARHCSTGNGKKESTDQTVEPLVSVQGKESNDTVSRSSGGLGEILRSLLQREEDLPDQPFDVFHAEVELAVGFDYPSASQRELKFRVQQKLSEFDDLGPAELLALHEEAMLNRKENEKREKKRVEQELTTSVSAALLDSLTDEDSDASENGAAKESKIHTFDRSGNSKGGLLAALGKDQGGDVLPVHLQDKLSFADVGGNSLAKEALMDFLEIRRDAERAQQLGVRPPAGAIMHGPPGTGKTLLARAFAAESSMNFIASTGSGFIEVYGGSGPKAVRDLFKQGDQTRHCQPCLSAANSAYVLPTLPTRCQPCLSAASSAYVLPTLPTRCQLCLRAASPA